MANGTQDGRHRSASDDRGSSSVPEQSNKRKRQNISRACTICRRKLVRTLPSSPCARHLPHMSITDGLRRTRCDGQPRCATCKSLNEECVYEGDQDGRRPATKQYVESLKNRIKLLEEQSSRPPEHRDHCSSDMMSLSETDMSPVATAEIRLRSSAGAIKVCISSVFETASYMPVYQQFCRSLWPVIGLHASSGRSVQGSRRSRWRRASTSEVGGDAVGTRFVESPSRTWHYPQCRNARSAVELLLQVRTVRRRGVLTGN